MTNQEILTDDYVAGLLAKDAKESSIKYSALGLEAFSSSSKPPANKPKPNTRFLRNIIKDTDSHNAALLAKEAAESRARLESLASNEHRQTKAGQLGGGDIRRRQLGDIAAILGGRPSKPRKTEKLKRPEKEPKCRNTSSEDDETKKKSVKEERRRRRDEDHEKDLERSTSHKSHRRRHRSESEDTDRHTGYRKRRHRSRSRSPREHRESRHRHRSPKRERSTSRDDTEREEKSHRSYHSSSKRKRSTSRDHSEIKKERSRRSHLRSQSIERYVLKKRVESPIKKQEPETELEPKPGYDSDPLDDIIGPRPPLVQQVRTRGRGTISQASGIDSRFSSNYDPNLDVQLDPDEEDDWDQALEALRDRQKWKQQGADRLRAAGFTEDEIVKWEKGGEKREEDVRWSKKGEGREWDRGKVLDDDGVVSLEPEWGRLKGT